TCAAWGPPGRRPTPRRPRTPRNSSKLPLFDRLIQGNRMNVRRLGRTGLKVSEICLGTMTFGHQCDERTSFAILDKAAAAGVTFLDTADAYPVPPTPE